MAEQVFLPPPTAASLQEPDALKDAQIRSRDDVREGNSSAMAQQLSADKQSAMPELPPPSASTSETAVATAATGISLAAAAAPERDSEEPHLALSSMDSSGSQGDDSDSPLVYIVQPGDTLAGVSLRFGMTQSELKFLNHMFGGTIYAGQRLRVMPMKKTKHDVQGIKLKRTISSPKVLDKSHRRNSSPQAQRRPSLEAEEDLTYSLPSSGHRHARSPSRSSKKTEEGSVPTEEMKSVDIIGQEPQFERRQYGSEESSAVPGEDEKTSAGNMKTFLSLSSKRRPTFPKIPKLFYLPSFLGRKKATDSKSQASEQSSCSSSSDTNLEVFEGRLSAVASSHEVKTVRFKSNEMSEFSSRKETRSDVDKPTRSLSATSLGIEVEGHDSYRDPSSVQTLPRLLGIYGGEIMADESLSVKLRMNLECALPRHYRGYDWVLLYSLPTHGTLISTFYNRVSNKSPTILVVETSTGDVFGAFASKPWRKSISYYGTGESFLWTTHPDFECFQWNPENNSMFMFSDDTQIALGGGGGFGLYLNSDFSKGASECCETFSNRCLGRKAQFDVLSVECWGLVPKR